MQGLTGAQSGPGPHGDRDRRRRVHPLCHDPEGLVLDKAVATLDNLTEWAVMEAVGALGGSKTVIMIAHRRTTVMDCDRACLPEKGCVAPVGTYDALPETGPTFGATAQEGAA